MNLILLLAAAITLGFLSVFSIADEKTATVKPADYVFLGEKIYTVNSEQKWAEAVAISGGVITYVGSSDGVEAYIDSITEVHDLGDQLLMPGFIDTHAHPVLAAASMNVLEFEAEDSLEDIYSKLKSYAEDNEDSPLILGFGFSPALFDGIPNKEMLDNIIEDRPVFLIDSGGHLGWANSKALEVANVTKNTPDPISGSQYYVRSEDGTPLGYMYEESTFSPFISLGYDMALSEIKNNSQELFSLMSSFGITSVFDASMEWYLDGGLKTMKELHKQGGLPFRLVASLAADPVSDKASSLIDKYGQLQKNYNGNRLSVGAIKIGLDGTLEGESAALLNNYLHGGQGALNWDPKKYNEMFIALDKVNIDVHIHAIGDRAVNLALNAISSARAINGFHGTRHTICHTQLVQKSDINRFKSLDVIAQTTPIWHSEMPGLSWKEISDKEREKSFPFRSISETGARVTFGSDFPYGGAFEALIPVYNIEVGHRRIWPGNEISGPLPNKNEKLNIETLIKGYTLDAAYQLRMESLIGSIEVGKRADLIVLDENVFDIPETEIHKIKVEMTMVDGVVVYERPFYQWFIEWMLEI